MTSSTRAENMQIILLELLTVSPIIIILGNIVPPFPIKIHFIGFGFIFLISIWLLIINPSKKWILYVAVLYGIVQLALNNLAFKGIIDYFFGPFILIVMLDLIIYERLPIVLLEKYQKRFYTLLWVPVIIAILQYFNIIPITFWNATYINYSYATDIPTPRPNGFLYHGAELSIIICFIGLYQYFKSESESFWMLLIIIVISLMTYFKAIVGCTIGLFLFYITYVNRGALSYFTFISKKRIFAYGVLFLIIAGGIGYQYFKTVYHYTDYIFPHDMLTGRGAIWNIYIDAIKEYTWFNYLFGSGIDSYREVFREYASADNFYPLKYGLKKSEIELFDTHNAILSVFVNSGIIGLLFFIFLFKIIYTQIKEWSPSVKWNKNVYFAVFLIPLGTIGVTIVIYEMAIFWVCLGFLFYRWKFYTLKENNV